MAKRKQKNVELERQLKQRKMIFRVVSIVIAAVIVFAIGFGAWSVQDRRWVLRYDGGRVATNDFRAINDIFFGGNPLAREAALESLQQIVTLRNRAMHHNADFTPEEREDAEAQVNWNIRTMNIMELGFDPVPYITDERLAELFVTSPLVGRLMDIYLPVNAVDVDEDEFAVLLESYLEDALYRHLDLQVHMLMLFDREEIEEAYELVGNVDFEDIMRQFVPGAEEEDELETISLIQVIDWFDAQPEDREYLLSLDAGDYTHIIELHDGGMDFFFIFYAVSREEPDPDAAAESFREDHIQALREDLFNDLVEEWTEESNFRVNRRGYNSVR